MLLELPRLTNSLRLPFDADQAYLNRKSYLQDLSRRSSAASLGEWELARKIIYRWDEASVEVRQLYKQFIAAVVELMVVVSVSEEFQEVALNAYRLFGAAYGSEGMVTREFWQKGDIVPMIFKVEICQPRYLVVWFELQKLIGHTIPDTNILKVASLVERLSALQKNEHGTGYLPELVSEVSEDLEFGADLVFRPPARFLVDISLEDAEILVEETSTSSSNHERWSDYGASANFHPSVSEGNFDLEWLRDTCDRIIRASSSQLPRDELAMTICRILDSDKPGDEVTVQTESERQIDKLRRKEEKKHRRGTDHGIENELSSLSFSSLLQASERKNFLDDIVGHGDGTQFAATALPQGTVRKHYKGYEEVTIPPTPTAPMKPGEKLIEIKELDDIAQAAFHGYKSLNRIQSRIFQTTYYSNENILVCAPTGAGKTNIAMISILHEIGQHFRDGYLHKDEFKIVYVAPMKALAAEVTSTFSHRLSPLNVTVRELTGDMQLSKNELEETQVLRKLEERGVDLDRLYEMEEKEIGALIRYAPGGKLVKQYLAYFPMVQLFATVSPITRTVLKVDLTITPEFAWKDRFHGTAQRWWILVEDSENDHIYHSELFTLTKKMAKGEPQKLSFTVPIFEPHPPQYFIRAISDSWLHAESFYTISLQNLALPEAHTTHTELLDLKPLPVTALGNETYEALYRFTHFNPIQTQAFHVLYHTYQNVLLGAPTGSGKTISAELAMLHLFNSQPDMKVIYIAPLKALVRERMNDWRKRLVSQLGKHMVGLMILDEIHLLGADRGPILEVIVSRMRYISSQTERSVRFVGLSTALANAHDLADWLGVEENGLFNFKPSVRPVPLEVHIQGYPGKFYCPRMNSMNKPTYAAICTHSPTKPVLYFVSSRRQTRLTALDLIQYAASDEHPRQFLSIPEESLQMVLVCTSTLAWGVNLPAHLVIIKGTEYFDGKAKRYVDFPITDILQMMGRAGRPQYDQHGKAIILVHEPKKSFYKKFLYEPFPVESSLREQLHDHINAEIVSGTISHKEDAVHYLTWTYLFRRLVVNPAYYGLEDTDPGTLSSYLSSLVLSTFEDLEDSGCIKIDEDRVFLHVLAGASEYDELPVRHNEENYNAQLSNKVRYMVDKNLLDDPHVKANLLLQAHFSRVEMPITDYVTDLKSVLDQSIRIIQAMIDLCANSGWLSSTLTCMHLLQMIMQGLWFDEDSPLWMLPSMTDELVTTLSQRGVLNIQQLLDLPPTTLQALTRSSTASRLHEELQHFPRIQARIKVQKRTAGDNPSVSLNIRLEKANRHKKTSRAFTPRFPKVKDEAWWLVLGNTSTSQLYALKRVTFTDVLQTHMNIPSNVNDFQGMKLIIVSDCYVGFEQEHIIEKLV
ncbi:UNVERIFIED_CONTAM: DExH-box ATP-dependent RNA helicase DExH14 [Sesamum angustifolium]|uniref:DExH-box ATP-dependent RNA helicase DExH14 n=1 Tax=Sesamum angustifolium TaxID=2727405 RepID=A0AAW2QA73_9LAMI